MKNIVLFLTFLVTCHFGDAYWKNRGHWHDHDQHSQGGEYAVHPPWWRNRNPGPNNEDNDNSNEGPSQPFRQWPTRYQNENDNSGEEPPRPRYPSRPKFLNKKRKDCDSSEEEVPHPPRYQYPPRPTFLNKKPHENDSSEEETPEYRPGETNVDNGSSEESLPPNPYKGRPLTTSTTAYPPSSDSDPGRAINPNQPVNVDIIAACVRGCPVTAEYNPVCGNNGVTYANPGRLECAQKCGVDVQISRKTACSVSESGNVTRTNLEACVSDCPVPQDFNPVCGTNNVTYANPGRIQCAKKCGVAVVVDKYAPCFRFPNLNDGVNRIEVDTCFKACPVKSTYQPVCGNNDVTYTNPDNLQCARKCGINVNIRSRNECPKPVDNGDGGNRVTVVPEVTVTAVPKPNYEVTEPSRNKPTTPSLSDVMACMQLCPLTSDYLPICGTDGITYTNPGRLLCSQFCGIDVNVKKFAPCESASNITNFNCPVFANNGGAQNPQPSNIEACLISCPVKEEYKPVCGTNNLTYKNLDELLCAKRCGIDVCVKKQSACSDGTVLPLTPPTDPYTNVSPTNPTINEDKDKVTDKDLGFTIPPDVLHSIFPNDNPYITPTTTENYEVDERFNEDPPTK